MDGKDDACRIYRSTWLPGFVDQSLFSHGVIRSRRRDFPLSFCHANEGISGGEFDRPPLTEGTFARLLRIWRGDLFSHPFGLRNASKETASWKGRECGSKKRGCDHRRILDDHPTPSSLKTMIIDERRSKGMEIRRNRFERYWTFSHSKRGKNGGIESIQRLIPMRCPLRKIYLGQRKGGKRNLAWKEANNKRRQ